MRLKEKFEDFKVREITNIKPESRGKYVYFILKKEGWNTMDAVDALSRALSVSRKNFGFAGLKDKNAITEQYVSVYGVKKEKFSNIDIPGLSVELVGRGKKPISLGDLKGNMFEILVKGEKINQDDFFVNYFGEQRFGIEGNNHQVGKAILAREFKEACNLIGLDVKDNFLGNLKLLGRKRLMLYFHAYQSYLWNRVVKNMILKAYSDKVGFEVNNYVFLKSKISNFRVPLPNFDVDIYDEYLKEEGLDKEAFILREIPELVTETDFRDVLVNVDDFKLTQKGEDWLVEFTLPKGSYATVFLKKLFK